MRNRARWTAVAALACALTTVGAARQDTAAAAVAQLASELRAHRGGEALDPGAALNASTLPGLSEARAHEQSVWAAGLAGRLAAIDQRALTHDQWLTYAIVADEARLMAQAERWYWLGVPVTPYGSPLRALPSRFATLPVRTDADRRAYLEALGQVPPIMAAIEAKMRGQLERGIVLPADEIALVVPFVRSFGGRPDASPFGVAGARLAGVPADTARDFSASVDAALRDAIGPAVARLAAFVDGPYRAKAPSQVGVGQYPGGADYYRFLIRSYTGLDLTPAEIHQIGLDEIARLNGELDRVRAAAGFNGSLAEFRTFLRTDARFIPRSADEIGERLLAAVKRIEPHLHDDFGVLPKAPYGVKRLEAGLEGSMTYGYYQQPAPDEPEGFYRYNGSTPSERSTLMAAALIYHELVPGHHLQIALTQENTRLDPLRRTLLYTAFTEGWGEYASDLAGEMGMYDGDPYARAGRLAMDLFLSSRLVVDTGMNALGWSRDRARAYMRENTLESDAQIATETLRYSCDIPGQALAYKLGSRQIREERTRVQRALGDRFDIRRFHDYILGSGAMPLGVLHEHVTCLLGERHKH